MKIKLIVILLFSVLLFTACLTTRAAIPVEEVANITEISAIQEETPDIVEEVAPPEAIVEKEAEAVTDIKKIYVAVSNFQINTSEEELQGLATDIPQTITEAFLRGKYIKPVERQEFERLFDEYKLSLQGLTDEETAVEVGKVLGAEYILLGSMIKVGGNVKMNCRLIRTATSEIVFTDSVRGAYDELFDLEEELSLLVEVFVGELEDSL